MAAVGPLTSFAIGICALLAAGASLDPSVPALLSRDPELGLRALGPLQTVLMWLGPINIMLAVFNLVPGFPLDGGRVLRAIAWAISGDIRRATRIASNAGKAFGVLLMLLGGAMVVGVPVPFLGVGFASGLWLLLIGWFLFKAAHMSYAQLVIGETLGGMKVAQLMRRHFDSVSPDLTVAELMSEHVLQTDQELFPVVDGNTIAGVVTARDAMAVHASAWSATTVRTIMRPAGQVRTLSPDGDVRQALQWLQQSRSATLPVVERGELRGILRGEDVLKWLALVQSQEPAHGR
jgi:CBS domain-containing protein